MRIIHTLTLRTSLLLALAAGLALATAQEAIEPRARDSGARTSGQRMIQEVEMKALQKHFEAVLSESIDLERALLDADPAKRERLEQQMKALAVWRATLEDRILKLADGKQLGSGRVVEAKAAVPKVAASPIQALPRGLSKMVETTTSENVKLLAYSEVAQLVAIANGNPSIPLKDGWKARVEVLEAKTGKLIATMQLTTPKEDQLLAETNRTPHFEVEALAFSPDGWVLAVGTSIGQVKLFNAKTGQLLRALDDARAKFADKKTPEKFREIPRAMGRVASLAYCRDNIMLAMTGEAIGEDSLVFDGVDRLGEKGTGPGRVKIWDLRTDTVKFDLAGHSHAYAATFSPDGNWLASAGSWLSDSDHGTGVILWNAQTGARVRVFPTEANGGTFAVAFSPDSRLLAMASRIFDKDKGGMSTGFTMLRAGTGIVEWQQSITGLAKLGAFSADGTSLVILCVGRIVRFFDPETGKHQAELPTTEFSGGEVWHDVAVSTQNPTMVLGGIGQDGSGRVSIWDIWNASGPTQPRR